MPKLPCSPTLHAVSSFPERGSSEVECHQRAKDCLRGPLRPLRRWDRLLSSAAHGIPLRDAIHRMLAFDIEHGELDKWPVHVNERWPNPPAIRRCCIWKRPVELAAVGSATANSPSPSLQFMRHSETVERDVQPLHPEKLSAQCTTRRLAPTGKPAPLKITSSRHTYSWPGGGGPRLRIQIRTLTCLSLLLDTRRANVTMIGSKRAIRIRLGFGIDFTRAVRPLSLLAVGYATAARAHFHRLRWPRRAIRDSVEEHRRPSFIAFGGPQARAGLSPGWAS